MAGRDPSAEPGDIVNDFMQRFRALSPQRQMGVVALATLFIAVLVYLILIRPTIQTLRADLGARGQELADLDEQFSQEADARQEAEREILTQEANLADAEATLQAQSTEISQLATDLGEAESQLEFLVRDLVCNESVDFTPNYVSNATMSGALRELMMEIDETVNQAEWQSIWDNPDVASHRVFGENPYVFIVSFENEDTGLSNSVFWVEEQCWLDIGD